MWHSRLSCVAAILLTVIKATLTQRCTVGGTQSNPGRCTPLRNCPQLADKFQPLDIANFIATHACGVEQSGTNDVLVCCPLVIAASGSISSGPRPEPVTCGSRKAAEDGADWPFMVGLGAVAPGQGLTIVYCNGALVAPLWVLTDASCLQQNLISTAFLGLGRADRSKIVSVPVVFTRRPTDFDSARDLNALALVKLGQPVSATDDIQFVCLPTSRGYDPSSPRYALYVTHIDDGSVAGGFDVAERSLHSVSLAECRASAGISVYPSDWHLCTNGLQACNVRMSRPLLVGLGEGGGYVLLGVGGVTNDRCTSDVTAFTEISKFDHWLKAIMEPPTTQGQLYEVASQLLRVLVNHEGVATCGRRSVAGGAEWPFMAGLGQASGQVAASFKSSCTAVLLTEQFLLTDARCLQNNQVNYAVVGYNAGPAAAVYVPIEAQLTPPYYVSGSDHNSVALVKLATNVSFSSNVQPVCVQHPLTHDNSSSLTALSTGYSIDDAGQLQFETGLEVVGRQINQVCSDSRFVNFNVPPEKYTCTSNILACEFLANPPVLLEEELNGGTYLVVGVGGDNSNFCKGDAMAFVRVGEHLAWIKSIAFPQGDPVLTAFG